MRTKRALGAIATAVLLVVAVSACSETDPSPGTSSSAPAAAHNDVDVTFATDMIGHHRQALEMADMAEGRDLDPDVEKLIDDIRAAQAPEIEKLEGWLEEWGEDVPADGGHGGHGMDGEMMPGMMSDEQMSELGRSKDAAFQRMWLTMMIDHHVGAVDMARAEVAGGEHEPAVELAQQIIDSQSAEIEQMRSMLQ